MSLPDRLSLVDASFLYSETRNVSMNVGALLFMNPATAPSGTVSRSDLIELLSNRIHQIPRLRQKLAFPPFGLARPVWVDDPSFRVEQHVHESSIPEPGSYRDLLNHVQEIHAQHFDRGHPLWQLHLITGLRRGRMAVVLRLHHALVDGVSALEILNMLLDRTRHAQPLDPRPWRPASEPSSTQLLSDAFAEGMAEPFQSAVSVASTLSKPNRLIDGVGVILRESLDMLAAGPLPDSPFNVPVGPRRRLAIASVSTRRADSIASELGRTRYDVALSVLAGALGRFLERRGESTVGRVLRVGVPFSVRRKTQRLSLGNRAGLFLVDLPVGRMDEARRVEEVVRAMRPLGAYRRAILTLPLRSDTMLVSPALHTAAIRLSAQQDGVNLLISILRGPAGPLYLCGARHLVTHPLVPLGARLALLIGVVSMGDRMGFGFTADAVALPDVDLLATEVTKAFTSLSRSVAS
jgi:diacylglycerol O-acyltransferase / wax synthase